MIEIPEALAIAAQVNSTIKGKKISRVQAAGSPHKFAWYQGDPEAYPSLLEGMAITGAGTAGGMLEIYAEDVVIVLSEGAQPIFYTAGVKPPKKHQMLLDFEDGGFLAVSVRMYGGILAFREGGGDNSYYLMAKEKPSPLSEDFDRAYFDAIIREEGMEKLSAKAFLATEQRIPGLGNGVLQDILFHAGIHPRKKVMDFADEEKERLFRSVKDTLSAMVDGGGRNTEKDLFNKPGGYQTKCSKYTVGKPCTVCGTLIEKASYMGGSVYFCPTCQPY